MEATDARYVLGTEEAELARLRLQAETIAPASEMVLDQAGIRPGMRVLELGTGLGHLAVMLARRVGPNGSVVAMDQSGTMAAAATTLVGEAGLRNVAIIEADVTGWDPPGEFDAIVARLLFIHLIDPLRVLQRLRGVLKPRGVMVVIDFDIGALRADPGTPMMVRTADWIMRAFRHLNRDPNFGTHAHRLLAQAGYDDVHTFGVVPIIEADVASRLVAGILATLAPVITGPLGLVTQEELDLPTLQQRIYEDMSDVDAVLLYATVTGTWGHRPVP